ncbi:MAG: hypothetical protein HPY66_1235 [Firmicutes bacterium]|nr:hypothetical protein [Bacillota bacterium]
MRLLENRLYRVISLIVLLTVLLIPSIVWASEKIEPLVEPQIEQANIILIYGLFLIIAVIFGGLLWAYKANRDVMKSLEQKK